MLEPLTITDAATLIKSGELTPTELLEQCFRRVDIYEHAVKAWVFLDRERARQEAARFTEEIQKGHYRGPLHGIPIGIKDIIDVFDMPTGCGSKLWANSFARRDATCVSRLRDAGAVILGKTVTTPYAYLDPPVTRNPWNLDHTPGGSSSGSAAAVACAMCLGALGTQTGGSLTRPASYCGVCSLKPSWGKISVDGVLPLAPSMDHVGIMARCVRDLAMIFEILAQPVSRFLNVFNYINNMGPQFFQFDDYFVESDSLLTSATSNTIVKLPQNRPEEICLPVGFSEINDAFLVLLSTEATGYHRSRQLRVPDDYPQKITELIEYALTRNSSAFLAATNLRNYLQNRFSEIFGSRAILITPATTDFAPTRETTGSAKFNLPWSFMGYPTLSIPDFEPDAELPHAIQLIADAQRELDLFESAYWAEVKIGRISHLPPIPIKTNP